MPPHNNHHHSPEDAFHFGGVKHHPSASNIKSIEIKTMRPTVTSLDVDSHVKFDFTLRSDEWGRFSTESLELQWLGDYPRNATDIDPNGNDEAKALRHSLRSLTGKPRVFIDPCTMGRCMIKKIIVLINGVGLTHDQIHEYGLYYTRFGRIYRSQKYRENPIMWTENDYKCPTGDTEPLTDAGKEACKPFDFVDWNGKVGRRVPIFTDGIFPFDQSNKIIESIDDCVSMNKALPPGTNISIQIYFHKNIYEVCASDKYDIDGYYSDVVLAAPANAPKMKIENITLSYTSYTLTPSMELAIQNDLNSGGILKYNYPVMTGVQRQMLSANSTYTSNSFPIRKEDRIFMIFFVKHWSLTIDDTQKKPLLAYSRFPANQSRMSIKVGGQPIIMESFEMFGHSPTIDNHYTMRQLYQYLQELNIAPEHYEQLWPRGKQPLNQCIIYDMKNIAPLTGNSFVEIVMEFSGDNRSPNNTNILFIPVSMSGELTFSKRNGWKNTIL